MKSSTKIALALIGSEVAMAAVVALSGSHMTGVAYAAPATDYPECFDGDWALIECSGVTVTVDGTDYPLCATEDCSDAPNQVGVWRNDGRDWLIVGENTYPVEALAGLIDTGFDPGYER